MIKIKRRISTPKTLENGHVRWTEELREFIRIYGNYKDIPEDIEKKIRKKYRKSDVKKGLQDISYEKCVYCEAKATFNPKKKEYLPATIDHFYPIGQCPNKAYHWDNLFLACRTCNAKKGEDEGKYDLKIRPIVNPEHDDPEEFFVYNQFGQIETAPNSPDSDKGDATIEACHLKRPELVRRLAVILTDFEEKEDLIGCKISEYNSVTDVEEKRSILANVRASIQELEALATDDSAYAGLMRYLLKNSRKLQSAKIL